MISTQTSPGPSTAVPGSAARLTTSGRQSPGMSADGEAESGERRKGGERGKGGEHGKGGESGEGGARAEDEVVGGDGATAQTLRDAARALTAAVAGATAGVTTPPNEAEGEPAWFTPDERTEMAAADERARDIAKKNGRADSEPRGGGFIDDDDLAKSPNLSLANGL